MTDPPRWRFVEGLRTDLPADVDVPAEVAAAAEHEQGRRRALAAATAELAAARSELETAEQADRAAEAAAAADDRPAPKPARAKAAARLDAAERACEAQRQAHKLALRAFLDSIWQARETWAADIAGDREQTRAELLRLVALAGALFERLGVLDELARALGSLAEGGGHVGGLTFAPSTKTLQLRRQRREELIAAALQPPAHQLGYRVPPPAEEVLATLAQHLHPLEPAEVEQAHALDNPAQASALAAVAAQQAGRANW